MLERGGCLCAAAASAPVWSGRVVSAALMPPPRHYAGASQPAIAENRPYAVAVDSMIRRHLPESRRRAILRPLAGSRMAIKSTIFKAELQLADLDRGHFSDYGLTLARHPSETDERMMIRLLAFILHASPTLIFGRGLSTDDEADLWDIDATGHVECWIDVGLPTEKGDPPRLQQRSKGGCRQLRWEGCRPLVATELREVGDTEQPAGTLARCR